MKATQERMDGAHGSHATSFGPFVLDAARGRLLRDGSPVALTPRAFAVLAHLVARAGELVEKAELLEAVWPHVVVEESNLSQSVYLIRRALDESPDDHRYIVTVPGRGYRFVAPVTRIDAALVGASVSGAAPAIPDTAASPASPDPSLRMPVSPAVQHEPATVPSRVRQWWVAAAVAALAVGLLAFVQGRSSPVVEESPSVAVLPFADLSPARDQGFFADGLAEDVRDLLAGMSGVRVVSRPSSFRQRGGSPAPETVAHELGIDYVLEGSVRRTGGRLRVTARLFEPRRADPVWSASYDRDAGEALSVQADIAIEVARALRVRVHAASIPKVVGARRVDPRAYEAELRGRFLTNRRTPGDFELATVAYREALAVDPGMARAWAGLASATYLRAVLGEIPHAEGIAAAMAAARRAIELDPLLAEAHVRLARCHCELGQKAESDAALARAKAIDPDDPLLLGVLAGMAAEEGRFAEAAAYQKRSAMQDPLSVVSLKNLALYEFLAGDLEAARLDLIKLHGLAPSSEAPWMLGQIAVLQRDFAAAREWFERARDPIERAQGLALVAAGLGQAKEADAALGALRALAGASDAVAIAEVHAYRGETDAAFEWLQRARHPAGPSAEGNSPSSSRPTWEVARSPFFFALHADPRWREQEAAARS